MNIYELQVKFLGEDAVDEGGPKREFWRLLGLEIKSKLCVGSEDRLTLSHNVLGLQVSNIIFTCILENLFMKNFAQSRLLTICKIVYPQHKLPYGILLLISGMLDPF